MTLRNTLFFFIPVLLLLVALPAFGATLKGGEEVSIAQDESISDDLYVAGGNVTLLGTVQGDVISVGGNVLSNGPVGADLSAAGGNVQVLAPVGDDIRLAGGQVTVGTRVGGDVVVAGGDIKLLSSSVVAGDAVIAGGRVVLEGTVAGDVRVWADEVIINGQLAGNVEIEAARITLGEEARISGDLTYSSAKEAKVKEGATILGEITFDQIEKDKEGFPGLGVLAAIGGVLLLGKLLITLVAALAAVILFAKYMRRLSTEALDNFGKNALLGFATVVVTPIGIVLIAVTFVGLMLAGIVGVSYMLLIILAKALSGIVAGALLAKWIKKEMIVDWKWAAFGVVVLQVVSLVPLVGWLVALVMFLVTFGAIVSIVHQRFWVER